MRYISRTWQHSRWPSIGVWVYAHRRDGSWIAEELSFRRGGQRAQREFIVAANSAMAYGEARFEQHQENAAGVGAHAKKNFVRILLEANIELAMVGARGKTTRQPTLRPSRNVDEPAADVSRKALSAVMHAKADSRQGMLALAEAGVDNDAIGLFMGCSVYTVRHGCLRVSDSCRWTGLRRVPRKP